eukprot:11653539-Ditylum_brightwellii.AAC.1
MVVHPMALAEVKVEAKVDAGSKRREYTATTLNLLEYFRKIGAWAVVANIPAPNRATFSGGGASFWVGMEKDMECGTSDTMWRQERRRRNSNTMMAVLIFRVWWWVIQ